MKRIILVTIISLLMTGFVFPKQDNKLTYKKRQPAPILKKIKDLRNDDIKKNNIITKNIIKKEKKIRKKNRFIIKTDLRGVYPPKSYREFKQAFHFAPVAQYYTSTCWSFSGTSYYESEIFRLTGKKIKLSEMWTVYYELLEKSKAFINKRGESYVSGGSETNAINKTWKKYGIVPLNVYTGEEVKGKLYDHIPLMKELKSYLNYIKANNLWNLKTNMKSVEIILNKYMGKPPVSFTFKGKKYTPLQFLKNVTGLNMNDYYSLMSTKKVPFYTFSEFEVPDNWWFSKKYLNLPLNVWYSIIKKTINKNYTIVIGGDVSEPGKMWENDIAFIPSFDIPENYINQDSREYRIYNQTTGDDHGIHLVGYKKLKGKDWFLIKDSGRSARHGAKINNGYYFFRGDFIRLKMLTFTIHKDMIKNILNKVRNK
jgi:bleomycin hydrolase